MFTFYEYSKDYYKKYKNLNEVEQKEVVVPAIKNFVLFGVIVMNKKVNVLLRLELEDNDFQFIEDCSDYKGESLYAWKFVKEK